MIRDRLQALLISLSTMWMVFASFVVVGVVTASCSVYVPAPVVVEVEPPPPPPPPPPQNGQSSGSQNGGYAYSGTGAVAITQTATTRRAVTRRQVRPAPPSLSPLTSAGPTAAIDDDRPIFCRAALGKRMSVGECSTYEAFANGLPNGNLGFNVPQIMTLGQKVDLPFSIALTQARADELAGRAGATIEQSPLKVSRYMVATMNGGAAFEITPAGPRLLELASDSEVSWTWTVVPKLLGTQTLSVSVAAMMEDEDGKPTVLVRSQSTGPKVIKIVAVPLTWDEKIVKLLNSSGLVFDSLAKWLGLLGGVIGAAGAVWVAVRKFGKSSAA
jgi:hypothetical protein